MTSHLTTHNSQLRIAVLGTRGFPNVQGGVEAHCGMLYPRLAAMGCDVTVFTRLPYVENGDSPYSRVGGTVPISAAPIFKGVKLVPIDCPRSKFFEAIIHTFKGIFAAKKIRPDILHIHGIGPSLLIPMARIMGFKVVMTNHGPDYERAKWGIAAKLILRIAEAVGSLTANELIAVSKNITDSIYKKYGRVCHAIPNGVDIPAPAQSMDALRTYGLEKGRYVLAVGRLVPEKGFHELIEAFCLLTTHNSQLITHNWKLVIVGRADHEDRYSKELKENAAKYDNVVLTGFLTGKPLQELYSHAGLFAMPSHYEALPIALLEAMSYGLSCIVSDIPANREIGLSDDRYFKPGDIQALSEKLKEFIARSMSEEEKKNQLDKIAANYNWDKIAERTMEVYRGVAGSRF